VAWSAVANNARSASVAATKAAVAAAKAGHPLTKAQAAAAKTQITHNAIAYGFSHGYVVSAGIALLALIVTIATIRVTRQDLAGVNPMAAPA
jgi:hypothetical protein